MGHPFRTLNWVTFAHQARDTATVGALLPFFRFGRVNASKRHGWICGNLSWPRENIFRVSFFVQGGAPYSSKRHGDTCALAAVAITSFGLKWRAQNRVREVSRLRRENGQMLLQADRRLAAMGSAPSASCSGYNQTQAVRPTSPTAPVEYRDEGQATPLAALHTFARACDRGDTARLVSLLYFDPETRAKAETYRASLPEGAQAHWPSVETLAAEIFAGDALHHPYPSVDILDTAKVEADDDQRVRLVGAGARPRGSEYQQTAEGWKRVVTSQMVDRYLAAHRVSGQ